jgi:DNA-binding NarL/FixJ family response regulator
MNVTKILIVEDEGIVAFDLKSRLTHMGYLVVGTAKRGEQAILLAEEMQPNLVLMDIHLQGEMDGIEAAAQIRSRIKTRIIYLTALIDLDSRQRADDTRPAGYLSKPFDNEILKTTIENALAGSMPE